MKTLRRTRLRHAAFPVAALFVLVSLSGCSWLGKQYSGPDMIIRSAPSQNDTKQASSQLEDFVHVDLIELLNTSIHVATVTTTKQAEPDEKVKTIEAARKHFYDKCPNVVRCQHLRDRVQDRLIAASNVACSQYKTRLRALSTNTNLGLGVLTTALAGAGTIFTSKDVIRAFAGSAGIASGVRAEYNDVLFASQAIEVITKGIELARTEVRQSIENTRRDRDITEYTLDAAIGDAIVYHDKCSVVTGLERTQRALGNEIDPGVKQLSATLKTIGVGTTLLLGVANLGDETQYAVADCSRANNIVGDAKSALDRARETLKARLAEVIPGSTSTYGAELDSAGMQITATQTELIKTCGNGPGYALAAQADQAVFDTKQKYATPPSDDQRPSIFAQVESKRAAVRSISLAATSTAANAQTAVKRIASLPVSAPPADAPRQ